MQIKLSVLIFVAFSALSAGAQTVDTVLIERFEPEPMIIWGFFPFGDDTTWVNVDVDGLTPSGDNPDEYNWFLTTQFHTDADSTGYINGVAGSFSWLQGDIPGNRNWLVTPPITVEDDTYTLHWRSAPFQLPRFMDGYSVRVSTTNNDMLSGSPFTDTIFRAASMQAIIGDGQNIDLSNYTFTPGYFHADSITDWDYIDIWAEGDSTLLRGFLQPHSVSLADYAGQNIYIAFVHDSDDDFYFQLDDVLVTRGMESGSHETAQANLRFMTYPNPADLQLNVMYRLPVAAHASLRLIDMNGRIVREVMAGRALPAGEQLHQIYIGSLPPGAYTVALDVEGTVVSRTFTKK